MQSTCSGKNVSNSYNLPGSNTHNNPTFKDLLKLQPSNATNHQLVQQPQFVTKDVQHDDDGMWSDDEQVFHNGTLDMGSEFSVTTAVCGEIYRNYHEVSGLNQVALFIREAFKAASKKYQTSQLPLVYKANAPALHLGLSSACVIERAIAVINYFR